MKVTDRSIERMVSVLLLGGVIFSALVVLSGGIFYLLRHGGEPADFRTFRGEPDIDRKLGQIVRAAFEGRAQSVIQLGIVLLILTPVARVLVALIGFAFERDSTYVAISAIVLAILLYSFVHGALA